MKTIARKQEKPIEEQPTTTQEPPVIPAHTGVVSAWQAFQLLMNRRALEEGSNRSDSEQS